MELKVFGPKRFYTRGTLRGLRISRLAKIPYLLSWLAEILKLRRELMIWERVFERHSLYYTKCCAICWSIIKFLFFGPYPFYAHELGDCPLANLWYLILWLGVVLISSLFTYLLIMILNICELNLQPYLHQFSVDYALFWCYLGQICIQFGASRI